jgi:hypothetical protein
MARSLGNALHQLQAYVHPHVKHVITQSFQQAEAADFEDRSEWCVHVYRQAVRIQRGEQVDRLTALQSDSETSSS